MKRSTSTDPHHPRRQPAAAGRSAGAGADGARDDAAYARARAARGRRRRARAGRARASTSIDDGEMSKPSFITYVTERLGGFERERRARARCRGPARRGRGVPGVLRAELRAEPERRGAALRLHRARSPTRGHAAGAGRHRQPQGRAGRRRRRGGVHRRRSRRRTSRAASATTTTRPTRSTCSRSPTRCARNTGRSSTPGFLLQIDDPRLVTYYIREPDLDRRRVPRAGPRRASRRSTTRCAASRASASASTPATASTWARACTTWS